MSDDEYDNEASEEGTFHMQCSALGKGNHVVINGRPCRISKITQTDNDMLHLEGIDIFTRKTLQRSLPANDNVEVPRFQTTEYSLVNIDEPYLNLMDQDGTTKDDVKVPEGDIGVSIRREFEAGKEVKIKLTAAMGDEQATSYATTESGSGLPAWKGDIDSEG